ncbi:SDR family oxidoreductase [Kineosporia mesophila]|uniref:SDR family oxidoreductase n=1 Tax=Kineosporia mesophila TaxID=566012 RepID=A0ABP6Z8H8_9ACTN|nr:NAD(P)H-binding protein [Kineosporia mesophila]MCD5354897.1 NAD(P)H-binding protein [Kineosporia mesophila]
MSLAISGASGAFGRAAAEYLLHHTDPGQVVLTTRRPGALSDLADRGADVRHADFNDPASLDAAFRGVERLLLISIDTIGDRVAQHRAAITAAAAQGVGHVVYTSVPEPVPGNPALVVPDHADTEQALRDSPMTWTFLRNNLYAHLQAGSIAQAAATGHLVTNGGAGAAAYVSREDCAAGAGAVLAQGGHENRAYDVTGPQALTADDLAALATRRSGREVEVVHLDDDAYTAALREAGLPEPVAHLLATFGAATRGGYLSTVTPVVADLTGRGPTALAELLDGTAS